MHNLWGSGYHNSLLVGMCTSTTNMQDNLDILQRFSSYDPTVQLKQNEVSMQERDLSTHIYGSSTQSS